MPSPPNAGCHLNSDHKHNSWEKGKQKPQRHHRALLNICKQLVQESQPIPAPSIKTAGQRQPRSASLTTEKHRFLPRCARSELGATHFPEVEGRCAAEAGREGVGVGEAPGEGKLGSCGMYAWDKVSCFLRLHGK